MRKKFIFLALGPLLFALSPFAEAQQPKKIPRIGYLSGTGDPQTPGYQVDAFREGLRDLGYRGQRSEVRCQRKRGEKPDE